MATIDKNLGTVTAYKYAKNAGYEGTEEEFAQGLKNSAEYADNAQASATAAAGSATDAQTANTNAQQAKTDAETAKTDAETAKTDAETAARNAEEWASQVDPDNLAHIDGSYPDMTVGNAEQLVPTIFVEDTEPYNFRAAGVDIGNREYDEIVGGSLPWNQLYNPRATTFTNLGVTITIGADCSYSIVGTATGSGGRTYRWNNGNIIVIPEHKYLFMCGVALSLSKSADNSFLRLVQPNTIQSFSESAGIYFGLNLNSGRDYNEKGHCNIFDLTAMFGTTIADYVYSLEQANAGAGIAWVRRYLPNDYYSYNPGSMESVQVSAHKMVGFNAYNPATGTARVLGNMTYQITGAYTALTIDSAAITPDTDGIFTPNANGTLTVTGGDSATTCVHIVHSGYRNGEYEPYVEHNYPLDDSLVLRGVPKLDANNKLYFDGDIYSADGTVTRRYGIVDMGTLKWERVASTQIEGMYYFRGSGVTGYDFTAKDGVCLKYLLTPSNQSGQAGLTVDKVWNLSVANVLIRDDSYTDVTSFAASLSNVKLVYKLATPTTETAEPFQSPQIVDDFGTEEYVDAGLEAGTRDFAFPVGHDTKYPPNLRDKLQHLPSPAADNGRYVIQQTDKAMTLVPDTSPGQIAAIAAIAAKIPDAPTTDGTYRLTVTVTDGTPAYSWVQA